MVILFYGLSGSGKTTLANEFSKVAPDVFILDGDLLRNGLCSDLGFSAEDRRENLRRVIHCGRILSLSGKIVVVAMIAPYKDDREMAKDICSDVEFVDVFIDCPLVMCKHRDPKGLYKKAADGLIKNFTGIDDPFDFPTNPTFRISTISGLSPDRIAFKFFQSLWRGDHLSGREMSF